MQRGLVLVVVSPAFSYQRTIRPVKERRETDKQKWKRATSVPATSVGHGVELAQGPRRAMSVCCLSCAVVWFVGFVSWL